VWNGGHAVVGPILAQDTSSVTRHLRSQVGRLREGEEVGLDLKVWDSDPKAALGLAFEEVAVPGPLGVLPAWYVPGAGSTWAIYIHGINGDRAVGLRSVRAVRRAGYPSLLISYRNDAGAPGSPDGHIHLGMTEWQDLAAAARYALSHGARGLVLIGYSMGATIASRFMRESHYAKAVRGLVFDSPVLDWRGAISHVASRYHIPFMARPLQWAVSTRIDVDWGALDTLKHAKELHVPILEFHGLDDSQVPASQAAALAKALPRRVTYVPVSHADHLESWNIDPAAYERHLTAFLEGL
jgi:pimeloyl-ACP methyl ester carboxylesterase